MKLQKALKSLMIIVSAILVVISLVSGAVSDSAGEDPAAVLRSFLGMLALMTCIGTVIFTVSGGKKPLDWLTASAGMGTFICICVRLGYAECDLVSGVYCLLNLLEFLLALGYRAGRRFRNFT